ncbi:MAG: hypothetical protein ACR2H3_08220 [Acidimicrobiales bacterium]
MYVGHIGIALATKSARRDVPVAGFVGAAFLLEHFKHWLWLAVVLPAVAGLVVLARSRDTGLALLIALTAFSHFPADLVTSHLELAGGSREIGLGWYRYPVLDLAVEGVLILAGWRLYAEDGGESRSWSQPWQLPLLITLIVSQAVFSFFVAPQVV